MHLEIENMEIKVKKITISVLFTSVLFSSTPALALNSMEVNVQNQNDIQHSGGCRKSSPPGQCCHAGSKPLHCH